MGACLAIVLAAGRGTRMRSSLPKVLHPVARLPMVRHVISAAEQAGADRLALVIGHGSEAVREAVAGTVDQTDVFEQSEQLGTAHAVLAAREAIERGVDQVLVLFGDTPLLTADTLTAARAALVDTGSGVVVVGFETSDPSGYGRLLMDKGRLTAIREEKDATEAERSITHCNAGIMAIDGSRALALLDEVGNDNVKGEFYLTDIVEIARAKGLETTAITVPPDDVRGVNTLVELAEVERVWQQRRRGALMLDGVHMPAPETVHLAYDTTIERGATIEPFVVFGPGAHVEAGAVVHSHSHVEGAAVGPKVSVGPFARLRPGAELHEGSRVGNFVEVKAATVGYGAKINHLSYVGDARIGANANIGAGTITCNYDGIGKHHTGIGADAFIGSNTALVAPVTIGDGAYVASGSVITRDVPSDAVGFGRARQVVRDGYARTIRERARAAKAAKAKAAE